MAASGAVLWLAWPLLRPAVAPARGATLVVVFDGYHRLDAALAQTPASQPLLLISCPRTGQPTPSQRRRAAARPFHVVRHGADSARQLVALAQWLQAPPPSLPPLGQVLLVSDSHHMPRLLPAARVALGSRGLKVAGLSAASREPPPGAWPISRDWLRLQLWRATASTGAFLVPEEKAEKQEACG